MFQFSDCIKRPFFNFDEADKYDRGSSQEARVKACNIGRVVTHITLIGPFASRGLSFAIQQEAYGAYLFLAVPLLFLTYHIESAAVNIFQQIRKKQEEGISVLLPEYTYQVASLSTSLAFGILDKPLVGAVSLSLNLASPIVWYMGSKKSLQVLPEVNLSGKTDREIQKKIFHLPQLNPGECIKINLSDSSISDTSLCMLVHHLLESVKILKESNSI